VTAAELDELERLADGAPADLSHEPHGGVVAIYSGRSPERHGYNLAHVTEGGAGLDALLTAMCAARNALPRLIAALREAREFIRDVHLVECKQLRAERDAALATVRELQARLDNLCRCSMRTRALGDGCEVCNPELAAEIAAEADAREQGRDGGGR